MTLPRGQLVAKSGWDVGVFQKRAEEGEGLCTEVLEWRLVLRQLRERDLLSMGEAAAA